MSKDPRKVVVLCRLSYTYIAEPQPDDEKKDKEGNPLYAYKTQFLIPKSDKATRNKIQKAIMAAIAKKYGQDKVKKLMNNPQFKLPMRDADAEDRDGVEYKGMVFANCKTNAKSQQDTASRPGVALKNRTRLTTTEEIQREIYSGCWAYLSLTFYDFKMSGSQGIAVALNNVLKHKDDERLDGSSDVMDDFDDLFEDDDGLGDDFDELDGGDGDLSLGGDDDLDDFPDDIPF